MNDMKIYYSKTKLINHVIIILSLVLSAVVHINCCSNDCYERERTEELLGLTLEEFPPPEGIFGYSNLPDDAKEFKFILKEKEFMGESPEDICYGRPIVRVQDHSKNIDIYAFCGYPIDILKEGNDDLLAITDQPTLFDENQESEKYDITQNIRHRYGSHMGFGLVPSSIFIGTMIKDRLKPVLIFHDVGTDDMCCHYISVDEQENCYLVVSDINMYNNRHLKEYLLQGNLNKEIWERAWMIFSINERVRGSFPWAFSHKDETTVIWNVNCEIEYYSGIYAVTIKNGKFTNKIKLSNEATDSINAVMKNDTGDILIVYIENGCIYGSYLKYGGRWTKQTKILSGLKYNYAINIEDGENDTYIINISRGGGQAWQLKIIE